MEYIKSNKESYCIINFILKISDTKYAETDLILEKISELQNN